MVKNEFEDELTVTVAQAARWMGVSVGRAMQEIHAGHLEATLHGYRWRTTVAAVQHWVSRYTRRQVLVPGCED